VKDGTAAVERVFRDEYDGPVPVVELIGVAFGVVELLQQATFSRISRASSVPSA
jgi:hypothetical protein